VALIDILSEFVKSLIWRVISFNSSEELLGTNTKEMKNIKRKKDSKKKSFFITRTYYSKLISSCCKTLK